jgi:putative glutamine amidotransferase
VIGIATQTLAAIPGQLPPTWVMGQKYVRVLAAEGAVPWLVPLLQGDEATLRCVYERLDGLFLTGGVDVDPASYGEARDPRWVQDTDPARDWAELTLLRWALADRKPVLGVCRGHQAINVAAGGTLYQDVRGQLREAIKHDYFSTTAAGNFPRDRIAHEVRVPRGSRLSAILGSEAVPVNSMHHQGVKGLAPGLRATAFAPDGLVEGLEGPNGHYLVGVQWHPEELADKDAGMRRLFTTFLQAAADYQHP